MLPQVPELADGGYWYAVQADPEEHDPPGWAVPIAGSQVCFYADIDGVAHYAVRKPRPDAVAPVGPSVTETLNAAGIYELPFARSGDG